MEPEPAARRAAAGGAGIRGRLLALASLLGRSCAACRCCVPLWLEQLPALRWRRTGIGGCLLALASLLGGVAWCLLEAVPAWQLRLLLRLSCSSCWFFSPLRVAGGCRSIGAGSCGISRCGFLALLRFLGRWLPKRRSRRPDRRPRLASVFVFFFFFLVVVVELWSSVELPPGAWPGREIPDSTNNMQSAIIHVLSLVCSLLMISSSRSGLAVNNCGSAASGRLGASRPACGATIMTLRPVGVNQGNGPCGADTLVRRF